MTADVQAQPAELGPPVSQTGLIGWLRQNLFSSPLNTVLTFLCLYLIYKSVPPIIQWAVLDADIAGTTRQECTSGGACWIFIKQPV